MKMRPAFLACLLLTALAASASRSESGPGNPPPGSPVIKVTDAVYRLDRNVLEFSFTVTNPSDSVVYVDCEGQPVPALAGKALSLSFAAADSLAADTARPQRVGARQGYRGSRRIFGLGPDALGTPHPADPAKAASLQVRMAVYPERPAGEGAAWMLERGMEVEAKPAPLRKLGKRPPAPKPVKVIRPAE